MIRSLRNFIVAIVLITGAKLIEVNFYHILKIPGSDDTSHASEGTENSNTEHTATDELEQVIESTMEPKPDTVIQNEQVPLDSTTQEQTDEISRVEVENSASDDISSQDNTQSENTVLKGDDYFQNLKNSYLSPILANLPQGRSREDVVIRYYKHEDDGNKVYTLRNLGYYLHERAAEDNQNLPSNALYYGSDVDVRDIQLVAYTLLKAGMPLKAIKKSAYDWKFNSLEVGADSLVENNPLLSISDIEAFTSR